MTSSVSRPRDGTARGLLQHLRSRLEAPESARGGQDGFYRALEEQLRDGAFGTGPMEGPALSALPILLRLLDWRGSNRVLAEALPHDGGVFDDIALFDVLARLGLPTRPWRHSLAALDTRLCPVAIIRPDGAVDIVTAIDGAMADLISAEGLRRQVPLSSLSGDALTFEKGSSAPGETQASRSFLGDLVWRLRGSLGLLLFLTMLINLVSLVSPFVMMAIYDSIIPARAFDTLVAVVIGVLIAALLEVVLRSVKARIVGFLSGRIDFLVSTHVFAKLLSLPFEMTATIPTGAQVSKLNQFENLREVFSGPLLAIALELPFILLVVIGLLVLAPQLMIGPLVVAVLFLVVGIAVLPALRRRSSEAGRLAAERQAMLLDTFSHMRAIRAARAVDQWRRNLEAASAAATLAQKRVVYLSSLLQSLAQMAVPLAGVATITFGTALVFAEQLTIGGLVAGMMLVWRLLGPLQQLFLTAIRLSEIAQSLDQLNQFMALRPEGSGALVFPWQKQISGELKLTDVGYRYPRASEPAVVGVNIVVQPGELVAVMGSSGAGKSTLLRIILGLIQPQGGTVSLDGVNLKQFDPAAARAAIGYVPQAATFFSGSIIQNMRLAAPAVPLGDIKTVLAEVGALETIELLPEGLDTQMSDANHSSLSEGLRQSLALAQALLRQPRLLLLDEPAQALDPKLDAALVATLKNLKGKTTVIMVTHRPSHAALADKVAVVDRGRVIGLAPPEQVLPKLERMLGDVA
ncbi:MAG: ATP-binding cassette domain-containing protein [Phreatobacter sp.]|nr:ATP-binding cassette domain-containing protein [Phreatobacter sp.]